jgi:hypothetical protein
MAVTHSCLSSFAFSLSRLYLHFRNEMATAPAAPVPVPVPLELAGIKCPVDDCNKEDRDEPNGFFAFSVSTKTSSVRVLTVEGKSFHILALSDFDLTDSHVLTIVTACQHVVLICVC